MAERFTKLFTAQGDLYSEGSPVILRAGALLLDILNTKALAQLKFQSISSKKILSLTVALQPQTSAGSALGDTVTHTYLDLSVERNAEFGSQTPIYLPDAETRAFVVHIAKVEFSDHTVWEAQEAKWAPLVFPTRTLEEVLQSPAAIEEYQRRFGMSANIMPEAVGDLWRCSCGALNHCDEESCHRCAANLQEMCSVNAKELEQEHFYLGAISLMERGDDNSLNAAIEQFSSLGDYKDSEEKKAACEEMIVQNGINRKKVKKISIIFGSIIAGIAACAAIICMGILPSVQINKATELMEAGQDDQAMLYLDRSGSLAQSFRSSQYHTIRNGIYSRAVNDAKTLIEEGKYGEAYTLMTDRRCAWGDTYELAKALNDGDYQKAVNDYGMTHIIVPEGVTHLNAKAFQTCKTLLSVSLPSTLQEIGDSAFVGCSSLKEITIPDKVTKIGDSAFNGCTALTELEIPKTVKKLGNSAFKDCERLNKIDFYAAEMEDLSSYNDVFSGAGKDSTGITVNIGANVRKIPAYFFSSKNLKVSHIIFEENSQCNSIGNASFKECNLLTIFAIPDSITQIGEEAFCNCESLSSIALSKSLKSIGNNAFKNCKNLKTVYISDLAMWCNITFGNNTSNPLYHAKGLYLNGKVLAGDIVIPDGVTKIPTNTFYNCNQITSVVIPESVTDIPSSTFEGCSSLESITLPFVGSDATASKASQSTLFGYIFGTNNYEGSYAISQTYGAETYGSKKFYTFYIPNTLKSVTITNGKLLYGAFYNCSDFESIIIEEGVTSIGSFAFYNCTALKTITIPESVTDLGTSAFGNCSNIIKAENGVSYVDKWVIDCDTSLASVALLTNTVGIGANAFSNCSNLTSITIPSSVTFIGNSAFYKCSGLTSITLPSATTSIGRQAFQYCSGITSITIPSTVTFIADNAFRGCSNLQSVIFGENSKLASIGEYAFYDCEKLSSIKIPQSVSFIYSRAFQNTGLTSAIFEDTTNWEIYAWDTRSDEKDFLILSLSSKFFSSPSEVAQALATSKILETNYYLNNIVWIKT